MMLLIIQMLLKAVSQNVMRSPNCMIRGSPAVSMRPGFAAPMFDLGLDRLTEE
jgi:hypothetical protein